jgi:hypothetical protein
MEWHQHLINLKQNFIFLNFYMPIFFENKQKKKKKHLYAQIVVFIFVSLSLLCSNSQRKRIG